MTVKKSSSKSKGFTHDGFFKNKMKKLGVARSFFQKYLPVRLVALVDWPTLKLAPGEFVDKALMSSRADILYQANLLANVGHFKNNCLAFGQ